MTFDDDPFADLIPSRQDDDPFADLIPQAGLTNPQGVSAGDYGRAVMAGGGQLFSGAGWLASKVPGLEGAGQGMQRLGQQASDFWVKGDPNAPLLGEGMSPAARAEQGKDFIKKTDDGSGFFGYEWGDASPHTAGLSAAQSLLGTAAGMGVGGVMTKGLQAAGVGARTAGVIGYGAGEAGVASGSAGRETYRSIMEMPVEKLEIHPEFQELMEQQPGADRDSVKEQIANLAANQAAATTAGTTFALSTPMGALIGKIMAGVPFAATKPRAIGTAAAGEAGQEFLQSGAEQMAQNQAVQDYADQSRGIGEGVLNAAVGGAAAGGIMGGGLGFSAVTEVQGERDAIDSIKGIAENFAFDQISDEQLDNAIQTGHELHQKYKDAELKSALDALAAEQILRSADKIVPPGAQTAQQGPQAVPAEQIIGPEDDVATDPNALPQEPPGFFGPTAGLTMPGMQPPAQTTPPPETAGYGFTDQAPESFDPFADLVPQQESLADAKQELGAEPAAPQPIDPAILRQQKAKANYQKAVKIDERIDPLGVIIAKLGGVNSDEAEQNGFDKESFRGYGWKIKRVFNKNGDSLDGMRERLNGYGFDFPDVNSLIDALQEDMAGNRKYTPAGYETLMEKHALEPEREAEPEQPGINGQYDVPLDEYTGDMYEDADANEPEYNPNWGEEAKQLYELLEEASAIDKQAAKDIWESGRDERDVAVALYDFIRDNESGAQGDRGEGEAQQGTGAQAEAPGTAETTATEGVTPNDDQQRVAGLSRPPAETVTREPVSPGAELADTDTRKDQVQADVPAGLESVERYQWLANKEGGQRQGNRQEIHELTESLFNDYVVPTGLQDDVKTFDKYRAKYPAVTHISLISQDGGKTWKPGQPFIGSIDEVRPKPSNPSWVKKVDSFESKEARRRAATADTDLLGDDTRTAQSVADAKIQKDKKPAEEPALVQSGDELFANNGKLEPDLFDAAAHEAATSPKNDTPQPTEAQIEAGNYRKGHVSIHGLNVSIENPIGSTRSGTSRSGRKWSRKMKHHYGYIKGTVGRDKDHVDVFIGDGAEKAQLIYVVDQIDPTAGKFDEHKVVMTDGGLNAAEQIYLDNYAPGWKGMGAITAMPIEDFKAWVVDQERTKKPVAYTKPAKPIQGENLGIEKPENVDAAPQKEPKQQASKKEPQPEAEARTDSDKRKPAELNSRKASDYTQEEFYKLIDAAPKDAYIGSLEIDYGNSMRGQGKRSGGQVKGGMFDASLRGKKVYTNSVRGLPDYKEVRQDVEDLESHEQPRYAQARAAGFNHDTSMLVAYSNVDDKTAYNRAKVLENESFEDVVDNADKEAQAFLDKLTAELENNGSALYNNDGLFSYIHKSTKGNKWQVTAYNKTGILSDSQHNNLDQIQSAVGWDAELIPFADIEKHLTPLVKAEAEFQEKKGAAEKDSPKEPTKPDLANTDDVGGEMVYNRRQKGVSLADLKDADNDTKKILLAQKTKIWERPNYQEMVDEGVHPVIAHSIKQIYDSIPTKPTRTEDKFIYAYAEGIEALRKAVDAFLGNPKAMREVIVEVGAKAVKRSRGSFSISDLIDKGDTSASETLLDAVFPRNEQNNRWGKTNPDGNARAIALGKLHNSLTFTPDGFVKAMKAMEDGWPAKMEAWQRTYKIASKSSVAEVKNVEVSVDDGSGGRVWKDRYVISISGRITGKYETEAEASAALEAMPEWYLLKKKYGSLVETYQTKEAALDAVRELTKKGKGDDAFQEPDTSPEKSIREGRELRDGKNVSTEDLQNVTGFNKINFGNWLKGENNSSERQAHVNSVYDAVHDLAEVLNVPVKAVSLNGMLSVAIGAQGRGGRAAAHFVPGLNEINITRTKGAGSLAHEFAHGLDHYFANLAGLAKEADPFLSAFSYVPKDSEIRPEIFDHFKTIVQTMTKIEKGYSTEEIEEGRKKGLAQSQRYLDSWLKGVQPEKPSLKYPALLKKLRAGDIGKLEQLGKSRSYVGANVNALREEYKRLEGHYFPLATAESINANAASIGRQQGAEEYHAKHPKTHQVTTDFRRNAGKLESPSGKPYWATPWEMFARAFEMYVHSKLAEREQRNDYLTAAWKNETEGFLGKEAVKRYPQGIEREKINNAFDALIQEIKTKETDDGVAMFSRSAEVKSDYDTRIDDLFAGEPANRMGVKVLDKSDVLELLGYGDMPVLLAEGKVKKGQHIHKLTADHWKSVPEWLENPVAVFDSDTVDGRLVFIAPETLNGAPIVMIVEPNTQEQGMDVNLLVNAYERGTPIPVSRWLRDELLRYIDNEQSPAFNDTSGLRLPRVYRQKQGSKVEILTERNLVKMRQDTRSTEDGSFSINPPAITLPIIPHDAVEAIVNDVRGKLVGIKVPIFVKNSESALPQEVQDRAKKDKATGHVKAVYHKGSIYLVSPQFHSRLEVEEALAHELSGHYGGRILFDKDLQAAYQRLYFSLGLKGVKEIAKKNGIDMAHYFKTASEMPAVERPFYLVDELLAHMQGERVYDSLPDRVKRLIQEFWGAVRDRLRGLGFTGLSEYSDSDLALLLKRMRQAAKEGVIAEQNGEPVFVMASDDRTAFSRGNPGRASDTLKRKFGLKPKQGGIRKFIDRMRNTPWGDLKRHLSDEWTQGALDRFYGIKRAEQEYSGPLNAGQSGYIATRLSTGLSSIITATLHYGTPRWSQGILQKIPDSKGLLEVLGPVQEDINDWLVWMGSKRASRLLGEGRENNLTPAEIQEGLDLATGREVLFQQVADDYAEFMGKILDVAEGAGLIDPAGRAMWEHADYVPFYRMTLDEFTTGPKGRKGISHQTAGIRRLRGADAATNDLLENIIMNVTHLIDASMKNNALRKTIRNLAGTGLYEDASMEFKAELIPMSQVKRRVKDGLAAQGWDQMSIEQYIDMMPKTAIDGLQKMWAMKAPADADIVRVMVGGKAKYYRVFDHLLLRALTQINTDKMGGIVNVMRSFKRILTAGVTASPEFMARNFIRDAAHAWAINEDGFTLGVDSVRGARKTMKLWAKDVDHTATGGAIDMMFAGGSFLGGYIHGTDPAETARSIRAALRKRGFTQAMQDGFMDTVVDTSAKYWDKYREIGDAIENASREATYEASTKAGKSKAQAVFDAKDLMDYSMQGQWALFQFLGDTVPFFNARLQGLYKLKRAGAVPGWGSKGKVIMRGGMIAAASLALLALNWGDDRYEELEDWDKDIYWHFWIGDQHLRIPKPFEIGVIFGTIPERMARLFGGKDDHRKAVKQLWWNFVETFNLVGMPQMIAPTMEVYANRDSFTKRDIEGMADEGKLKSARYNEGTSETMRAIGSAVSDTINLSPKQLEHLWNGYLGTLGMYVLGASDMVVRVATDKPEAPSWRLDDYPVLKSFARSAPAKSTRYKTELYEMLRESEQVYRTIKDKQKQGLAEDAKDIAADNQGKLKARGALKSAATRLKALRQQVDHVYRDRSLTAAQKRERVDKLMERGNILARRAVEKTHPIFNQ